MGSFLLKNRFCCLNSGTVSSAEENTFPSQVLVTLADQTDSRAPIIPLLLDNLFNKRYWQGRRKRLLGCTACQKLSTSTNNSVKVFMVGNSSWRLFLAGYFQHNAFFGDCSSFNATQVRLRKSPGELLICPIHPGAAFTAI